MFFFYLLILFSCFSQNFSQALESNYNHSTIKIVPDQIIKLLAIFNKDMKTSESMIKRGNFSLDLSLTNEIYNWEPIPFYKTMLDMSNSLKLFL